MTEQINQNIRKGILVVTISLIINTLLVIFKYWIGVQISSIAIVAEAWHSLSDSLTSILVLIGFKMSSKPPDYKHPFGHGRTEVISSLIIALILALVAYKFLVESVIRLWQHQSVQYNQTALLIFIISLIIKEFLARLSINTGKQIKSDSLIADGWHHRSDALASLMVIFGIFLNPYFWWVDGVIGTIISLIIARIAYYILKDAISSLIGEKPEESFLKQLEELVKSNTSRDVQLHHIHLHKYGHHRELTFHIMLPGKMKLEKAHQIATQLEEKINSELSVETTIHVDVQANKSVID